MVRFISYSLIGCFMSTAQIAIQQAWDEINPHLKNKIPKLPKYLTLEEAKKVSEGSLVVERAEKKSIDDPHALGALLYESNRDGPLYWSDVQGFIGTTDARFAGPVYAHECGHLAHLVDTMQWDGAKSMLTMSAHMKGISADPTCYENQIVKDMEFFEEMACWYVTLKITGRSAYDAANKKLLKLAAAAGKTIPPGMSTPQKLVLEYIDGKASLNEALHPDLWLDVIDRTMPLWSDKTNEARYWTNFYKNEIKQFKLNIL